MDLGLQGKVAIVAAARFGLGRAIATELAREGARVVISIRDAFAQTLRASVNKDKKKDQGTCRSGP